MEQYFNSTNDSLNNTTALAETEIFPTVSQHDFMVGLTLALVLSVLVLLLLSCCIYACSRKQIIQSNTNNKKNKQCKTEAISAEANSVV